DERIAMVTRWMALTLGGANLRRAEERRIGMLSFLAEASDLLAGSLDTERSLALLARLPVPRLARWCAVYLLREDGAVKLAAVGHVDEAEAADLSDWAGDPVGPLAAQVRATLGDTVRIATINGAPTVITAMRARRRVLGVVALGRAMGNSFAADEIELFADLARRAAFAVDNARLFRQQVEVAGALQAGLLPPRLPSIDGIELGSSYRAARAGLEVGGDFFDLVPNPDGGWTIIIGDVCGKGAEAANVTGVARAVLRLLVGQRNNLPDIMMDLNRALRDAGHPGPTGQGRFCTLAAAELRPPGELTAACLEDGTATSAAAPTVTERVVSICMAGHPLPVVVRADGTALFVAEPGTLLGVLDDDDVAFPQARVALTAGDALVLYTDGVVEARRGQELFGDERLLTAVRGCVGMSAQGIADQVRAAAERFAGGRLRDDVAVVVARIPG
ncbi:PP2C family protein-serine/threonine phosphatase, partial [Frankia sp. CiP3]